MIVYCVKGLFSFRKRVIKMRTSDKGKRLYSKRYRRIWFWNEDKWNQRHDNTEIHGKKSIDR
jgi:hypothetical protein